MNSTTTKQVAYSGPPEFQAIAEQNTVLRGQVGSGLHGVTTGADDRDEMGVCIEPPEYVIGNARFEQYQFRTQPEGVRSGAGDLDLVVYSSASGRGSPPPATPPCCFCCSCPNTRSSRTPGGGGAVAGPPGDVHIAAGRPPLHRLPRIATGQDARPPCPAHQPSGAHRRSWLRYEVRVHAVRLGLQGVELLTTGRITLPIPEPDRTWLRELRNGEHTIDEALDRMSELRGQINRLTSTSVWPDRPNRNQINAWLTSTYQTWWAQKGLV